MGELSFDEIFTQCNIEEALAYLSNNKKDSCGIDGINLSDLHEYWEINGQGILAQLDEERYQPKTVQNTEIVNAKGKHRTISLLSSVDRLLLRCLARELSAKYDEILEDSVYSFRMNRGTEAAVLKACEFIEKGCLWCVQLDIASYYDSISFVKLEECLRKYTIDAKVRRLIMKYIKGDVEEDGVPVVRKQGLITGSPISPFLGNLFLTEFDKWASIYADGYVRFCDDIFAFFASKEEAAQFEDDAESKLREQFLLGVSEEKCGIFESISTEMLGYHFHKDKKTGKIFADRKEKKAHEFYSKWHEGSIEKVDSSFHLINNGVLTRKDYSLLFENPDGKNYIPVETTNSLNIYSNVIFSSDFFRFVADRRISVNIFNRYGECVGTFSTADNGFQGRTMLKQANIYLDESKRTDMARRIEIAAIHNIRANLKYYQRHIESAELNDAILKLGEIITEMNQARDVNSLLMLEARARQLYYRQFNVILDDPDFVFTERTKRPPKDALNAMISFGNTYIYNRVATEIRKTSLDIRVGFIHSVTSRSQSLNLDIAELFKPVIVDRAIFTLINKHMLNVNEHFDEIEFKGEKGVYLSKEGKRIFIHMLDDKLYTKQVDKNESLSYDTRIKREISKVFRSVVHAENYKPYKYQA